MSNNSNFPILNETLGRITNGLTIEQLLKKEMPLFGKNENGEMISVCAYKDGEDIILKIDTYQHNGWCRTNTYYEDGTLEELYSR